MKANWIIVAAAAIGLGAATLLMVAPGGLGLRIGPQDKILLIGDSLAQGLRAPLRALAEQGGVAFSAEAQQGTRVEQWGDSGRAAQVFDREQPTVVFVSLGTNDEGTNDAFRAMFDGRAKALVADMHARGAREVVWILPPSMPTTYSPPEWQEQIARAILDSGAKVFDSRPLQIPRGPDDIHPTVEGTSGWAAAIWEAARS